MVRLVQPSDVDGLIDLARRTISASYRSFLGDDAVNAFLDSGAADRDVQEDLDRCNVIEANHQVVGFAVRRDKLIDLPMIDVNLYRQGLGTTLFRAVEASLAPTHAALRLES